MHSLHQTLVREHVDGRPLYFLFEIVRKADETVVFRSVVGHEHDVHARLGKRGDEVVFSVRRDDGIRPAPQKLATRLTGRSP